MARALNLHENITEIIEFLSGLYKKLRSCRIVTGDINFVILS